MSAFRGGGLVAWMVAGGAAGAVLRVAAFYSRYPLNHLPPAWQGLSMTIGGMILAGLILSCVAALFRRLRRTIRIPWWLNAPAFLVSGTFAWRLAGRLPGLRFWDFGPPKSLAFSLGVAGLLTGMAATAGFLGFARNAGTRRLVAAVLLALGIPGLMLVFQAPAMPSGPLPPAAPRAILLITLDTVRADHVSAYGYGRQTTPFFDALAREGLLYQRAFAPMPSTDPSHAAMLTGELPAHPGSPDQRVLHHSLRHRIPGGIPGFPRVSDDGGDLPFSSRSRIDALLRVRGVGRPFPQTP